MKEFESGQTLIIVLLVVTVSLLVGAEIATRSTSVVQQTTFSEEATQALHFAEACAEKALGKIKCGADSDCSGDFGCNKEKIGPGQLPCTDIEVDVTGDGNNDCKYTVDDLTELFPGKIEQDDVVEVKLDGASCSKLEIYWCAADRGDDCSSSDALEVIVVYDKGGNWETGKKIFGAGSDFTAPTGGGGDPGNGVNYSFSHDLVSEPEFSISPSDGSKLMRIIPRYRGFHLYIDTSNCSELPHQGYDISTEGWFGKSRRKVRVTKTEPAMPPIFDYAIFSGSETQPLEKR